MSYDEKTGNEKKMLCLWWPSSCDTAWTCRWEPAFVMNALRTSVGLKVDAERVSSNRGCRRARLHGVTNHKTAATFAIVRTSVLVTVRCSVLSEKNADLCNFICFLVEA
jgi:hypothetical protein